MADSITQPNIDATDKQNDLVSNPVNTPVNVETIIWTPRFIMLFALTLVIGLTAECLFALGYGINIIEPSWVLLGHMLVVAVAFGGILRIAHSRWTRLGGIFGGVWVIFNGINLLVTLLLFDHVPLTVASINVATTSALLGAYMCFSLEQTPLTRWDKWFFGLAVLVSFCVPLLSFIFTPAYSRSLASVEGGIAATLLILSLLVWWLRPSCWRTQPGTTLLLGSTPAILLILAFTSLGRGQTNFFLSQVALLALLLGTMRIWQGELKRQQIANGSHS